LQQLSTLPRPLAIHLGALSQRKVD